MSLTLHVFPPSPRAFKVLVVAQQLGLDYKLAFCDLTKGDQKTAAYTALNPFSLASKAPAVNVTPEGKSTKLSGTDQEASSTYEWIEKYLSWSC